MNMEENGVENNKEEKVVIETGTTTEVKGENSNTEKSINICCLLSFIFAIIGIFIYGLFCGIIATVLGIIGVATFKKDKQKLRGLGIAGLAIGAIEFVVMALFVGAVASLL